jgi:hypothetical protein
MAAAAGSESSIHSAAAIPFVLQIEEEEER